MSPSTMHSMHSTTAETLHSRLEYPPLATYLLGGAMGSGLNAAIVVALNQLAGMTAPLAFSCGTMANLLFHHVYYHFIFINREIQLRTPWWLQGLLYCATAAGVGGAAWVLIDRLGLSFWLALVVILGTMLLTNSIVNRISTFSSARLADIEYAKVDESFYFDQTDPGKVNAIRAWFHNSRFDHLTRAVAEQYRPGMAVADLGCGNCLWNKQKIPVVGVDVNPSMLRWAQSNGFIIDYRISDDLSRTSLDDASFDIVVMSETLEHLLNFKETILEVKRILRKGGKFIITVPYDIFLGPFFVMFNINCLYQGVVRGSRYHLYRCGHVNHFTIGRLTAVLKDAGLQVERVWVPNGLTLFAVAVAVE